MNLAVRGPVPVPGRYRFDFAGPVRHHDVQLLPVVGALIRTSWTGLAEALGFGDQRFDPVAFTVKTALAADEREREGYIADSVGDLEGEIAEGHVDDVVPQHAVIDGERIGNWMEQTDASGCARHPGVEIFLDLLSDQPADHSPQI